MKRKLVFVLLTLLALVIFQTSSFKLQSHIVQPQSGGLANDPGQSNCAACHYTFGAPIPRNSQFILRIAPDSAGLSNAGSILTGSNNLYTPNHPNWISLTLTGTNTNYESGDSTIYGFQFTALKASPNDSMAGSFTLVDPYTSTQSSFYTTPFLYGPVSYVSHFNRLSEHMHNTWYFIWNAPDSNAGPVTFYYTGNLGDNYPIPDQPAPPLPYGDSTFSGSMTLSPGPYSSVGIADIAGNIHSVSIYPVPFSQELSAAIYLNTSSTLSLTLLSPEGQTVKELYNDTAPQGHFSRSFNIGDIAAGIYFVSIQSGADTKVVKVMKY